MFESQYKNYHFRNGSDWADGEEIVKKEKRRIMHKNYSEDDVIVQRMMSFADEQTLEWASRKMKELLYLMTQYKCAMMEIENRFNLLNEEYGLEFGRMPVNSIKTRLKTLQSIKEKMERRGYPLNADSIRENINDIAGIRVICAFPEDVYALADALLKQDDISLITRKDYIQNPKPNGYRSLHMIVAVPIYLTHEKKYVRVEIQLRTIAMDCWASLEHQLRYKSDVVFNDKMADELYECARLSAELDNRMDSLQKSVQNIKKGLAEHSNCTRSYDI